jgi:hypothetical protein
MFTIPLTEADAPPLSIVGVGLTWSVLTQQYGTWQELTDSVDSWRELMSCCGRPAPASATPSPEPTGRSHGCSS